MGNRADSQSRRLATSSSASVRSAASRRPADWPQWRGPDRTGLSRETGLLAQWPRVGPPVVWSAANLGAGYGSIAVQGDRVYVQGMRNRQSVVSALNRADGKVVWVRARPGRRQRSRVRARAARRPLTAIVLYVLTENGDLACLRVQDGTVVWQKNILKDFGGRNIEWLISESPLVDGNQVIVTPGGRGAGMVALDKMTGKTIWTSKELSDRPAMRRRSSPTSQGVRTIMTFTADAGVGVRASDGKLMWRNSPASPTAPPTSRRPCIPTTRCSTPRATAPAGRCSGCAPRAARSGRRRSTSRARCRTTTAASCW